MNFVTLSVDHLHHAKPVIFLILHIDFQYFCIIKKTAPLNSYNIGTIKAHFWNRNSFIHRGHTKMPGAPSSWFSSYNLHQRGKLFASTVIVFILFFNRISCKIRDPHANNGFQCKLGSCTTSLIFSTNINKIVLKYTSSCLSQSSST